MFGWTPLAGVVLSRILAARDVCRRDRLGVTLLTAYAFGRALSLLALGLAHNAALRPLHATRPHARLST